MVLILDGFTMPEKCEDCRLENYDTKTTRSICAATGLDVAWCRTDHCPNFCPLAECTDTTPVVRCRECEYWESGTAYKPYCNHPDSYFDDAKPDEFCSRGKRKEAIENV